MTLSKRRSEYPITVYPPTDIGDGTQTVTTAGTRVQLISAVTLCKWVLITAKGSNTGNIFVGGSTIASGRGKQLVPLQSIEIEIDDLSKIYIDASSNNQGVDFIYVS